MWTMMSCCLAAEPATLFDFTKDGHGWKGNHHTKNARQENGFTVTLTGEEDPWLEGPFVTIPGFGEAKKLKVILEAKCDGAGAFLLFYAAAGSGFSADAMASLTRVPGSDGTYKCFIPPVSERMRFRLDPPGSTGQVTVRTLSVEPLIQRAAPVFGKPSAVNLTQDALCLKSGDVRIVHDPKRWNAFEFWIGEQKMAELNPAETLAYLDGKSVVTVSPAAGETTSEKSEGGFTVRTRLQDGGGGVWQLARRVSAERNTIRIETSIEVSQPREVIHLPWLTLFAGAGSFEESKDQALLPGVEYLDNEPSSNEKEIKGAEANRRMVDTYRLCYPLMALAAGGKWLSIEWQEGAIPLSPLFDSPDRVFDSGGHVMGLWSPAVGDARFESEFVVYGGVRIKAGIKYSASALLCGGNGVSVTEAVASYVARHGLPSLPKFGNGFEDAVRLLSAGWLDSAGREGEMWRHAVWGKSFPATKAEDAPAYMLWLAAHSKDSAFKTRLVETAQKAIAGLPAGSKAAHGISHVRRPTGALLYGDLEGLVKQSGAHAVQVANRLADGTARYNPGKVDYASTLGSDHCNGYTAMSAEDMLISASLTGNEEAIKAALAVLDKMTAHYAGQVPRGAQPWEMPLHTPDIVASARLIRCYVLGYLLSGKPEYLEQARYWAWTGVTMVYLAPPTAGATGLYATIGVIGATNWRAPNWIGQPVQWCGLVYRSALEDLARIDEAYRSTWQTLARGITITGLQMCFPVDDVAGFLSSEGAGKCRPGHKSRNCPGKPGGSVRQDTNVYRNEAVKRIACACAGRSQTVQCGW